jgi:dTDP-glucose pyrophosphorylase
MKPIEYGVILAAGSGSRLSPLTKYLPKIVLPIFNKPLIIHHLGIMQMIGVKKVFIVVSEHHKQLVSDIISQDQDMNIKYEFIVQDLLGGTGHALLLLKNYLVNTRFVLLLGDEYYNDVKSFSQMTSDEFSDNILGVIEYKNIDNIMSGCNVIIENNKIKRLNEKPRKEDIIGQWCWDGSGVFTSQIIDVLDDMNRNSKSIGKDYLCIVKAMQQMLNINIPISNLKKTGTNINITYDTDLIKANLLECMKGHNMQFVIALIDEVSVDC